MSDKTVSVHIGSLEDMGRRFAEAWKHAEAGRDVARDHVTFLRLESFMAAMSPKRLELMRHLRQSGPRRCGGCRRSWGAIISRCTAKWRGWWTRG